MISGRAFLAVRFGAFGAWASELLRAFWDTVFAVTLHGLLLQVAVLFERTPNRQSQKASQAQGQLESLATRPQDLFL